ncbi:WD40-repeat-containing domain protein [Fennellomyces sp. T-0311]|nr:WD40-repeat-containing domain protein [Fennellomyces sp. T-0311]
MTIFDKLSGFAHKAKENALARAILAKDKRLDKSISEALDANTIGLSKMSTFGIPGRVSAVAFDPVAGLLAVGISSALTLNSETRIKYLKFQTGHPILVAVDMKNVVTTYDLRTKKPRHVVTTPSIVTSLEHIVGTDWLLVGFSDGNVDMFDMDMGIFSEEYGIPNLCLDENQQPQPDRPPDIVMAIQMHPTDLDLVLIGYESAVYLWSIRDQSIKKEYVQKGDMRTTCLTWSPCGTRFMAGYDNGYMYLWDIRSDHKPLHTRRVFHASPSHSPQEHACEPIFQMAWYVDDAARKSFLVVAGGSDLPDIRGLHVMEYDLDNSDIRDARKQTILATQAEVQDFILLSREAYFLGMHSPLGLLVIGCDGAIRAYGLDHGHPPLTLPPALQFLDPPVQQAYYVSQLPHPVFQKLIHQPQQRELYLPLQGGVAGNGHIYRIPSNDLLVTLHGQSTLRFWDASYTSLRPLSYRTIHCQDDLPNQSVQHVELDRWSGAVLVAMDKGVILVYMPDAIQEKPQPSVQDAFIENCDNTLQEISQLLEDMNDTAEPEPAQENAPSEHTPPVDPSPPVEDVPKSANSPMEPDLANDEPKDVPKEEQEDQTPALPPRPSPDHSSVKIELLDKPIQGSGFTLTMKITLKEGTVSKMVSSEKAL